MSVKRSFPSNDDTITSKQLKELQKKFDQKPENIIIRNAINTVGLLGACTDLEKANQTNHIYSHSIKSDHAIATDQGSSGRCWLLSGQNLFRHFVIKGLNLKNFEFSATYLFFYDKFERSNYFLNESLNHLDTPLDDRYWSHRLNAPQEDGGYFSFYANLVDKYGLVPSTVMPETFTSQMSEEINHALNKILRSAYHYFRHNKHNKEKIQTKKEQVLEQVYSLLVKFLGAPPQTFSWAYQSVSEAGLVPGKIENCTPLLFKEIGMMGLKIDDFITLGNYPSKTYNKVYQRPVNNVWNGKACYYLNLPMRDMKKFVLESIFTGFPSWMAADVTKGFHYYKFSFDDSLVNTDLIFGETEKLNKADRLSYRESSACHAMSIVGVDLSTDMTPNRWQVENSWGYLDPESLGVDGYYSMADEWFDDHVYEVVVHRQFLPAKYQKMLSSAPIILDYFDVC
jgi:bleomycin hydrolase